ncbi:outer membrane beta-barrel protein [bacterium]|nr:outer membrane beta-barrel protein [bacterium]
MKKHLLLIVLASLAINLFAQDKKFSLGFAANPNIGWISGEDLDNTDHVDIMTNGARLGFSYGLMGEIHFTENYHLALGINHVFTGGKFSGVNTSAQPFPTASNPYVYSGVKYDPVKLSYLHIPALIRLKTNEIGYIRYFGNIGFAMDFALNGKTKVSLDGTEYNPDNGSLHDFTGKTYATDVRYKPGFINPYFVVGLGGQYSLGGNSRIHMGIDYNAGLGSILSKTETEKYSNLFQNARFVNSYISLNVGIFL